MTSPDSCLVPFMPPFGAALSHSSVARSGLWELGSPDRELLKYAQGPRIISFRGGLPSPDAFPFEDLNVVFEELLHEEGGQPFQDGPTQGDPKLKEAIATRMKGRDIRADGARIIITHGTQQALELLGRIFLEASDIVIVT